MQKITFENARGESLSASRGFPYFLEFLSGVGSTEPEVLTQHRYQQDGKDYYGSLLEPREMEATLWVKGDSKSDFMMKRQTLLDVFNPKLGLGTLTYQNDTGSWQIEALVQAAPSADATRLKNAYVQCFALKLMCPDPAWESIEEYDLTLIGAVGGLTLPMGLPMICGQQEDAQTINYTGTLDAPLKIEFRGPVTMPKIIKNETGEEIAVELEIETGEKLYVITNPNDYDVYKLSATGEKTSAFNYIKADSQYFSLTNGTNTLTFSAAGGALEAYIYWHNRYVGV